MRFLFDTSVFMYALGRDHAYREPCRALLVRAQDGELDGEASVELLQEIAHVYLRRGMARSRVVEITRDVASACRLHAFEPADLPLTMTLLARHDRLDARDCVHAATALNRGIGAILSPDRAFDAVDGLVRVDPLDEVGVAELSR
jgi:uncharacterized protein